MPTTYLLISLALTIGLNSIFPIKRIIHSPNTYMGVIFILFGVLINVWADNLFKKSRTTVKPHETPTSLEVSGPFRISRHPMYLGMCAYIHWEFFLYFSKSLKLPLNSKKVLNLFQNFSLIKNPKASKFGFY